MSQVQPEAVPGSGPNAAPQAGAAVIGRRGRSRGVAPGAARRVRRDMRFISGLSLAGLGIAVAWIMWPAHAQASIPALVAVRDVPAGLTLSAADVSPVHVQVPPATASELLQRIPSRSLTRPVRAGALITRSDVASVTHSAVRLVSINVEPGHAPPEAGRGDVVEVWATPDGALAAAASRMVARVVVAGVTAADSNLGDRVFVVQVSEGQSAHVVSALRNHAIDLVEVAR